MYQYKFANDLGYSSMKLSLNDTFEHIPSVIAIQRSQNYHKPATFDTEVEQDHYFQNLKDHMDISIASPSVDLQGRFLVGQSALDAGLPTRAFDVNDFRGKSETDLSLILTLSRIANQVVTDAYFNQDDLNEVLSAEVQMATALPITEGKIANTTENYQARYLKGKHSVTIYNFKQPITVQITFKDVYVGLEGEMAQFKIANADDKLSQQIKDDFDNSYPALKDEVTAEDLTSIQNVLGIDIGEGTTDFAVIKEGKANATASTSLQTGYGNVLQEAVKPLQSRGFNFSNRGELNDFLAKPVSVLARRRQDTVRQIVADQLNPLVDEIIDTASETMRSASSSVELVYVYGGGSAPLLANTDMRSQLVNKLKGFSGGYDIPVVWINPSRAQNLNEEGLKLFVDNMFE